MRLYMRGFITRRGRKRSKEMKKERELMRIDDDEDLPIR